MCALVEKVYVIVEAIYISAKKLEKDFCLGGGLINVKLQFRP